MPKKIKSGSCSSGWCRNHVFQFNARLVGLHFRKKLRMRLCPYFNNNLNKFSKSMPVLNRDYKFYTPTFILEEQQKFYEENTQGFLRKHLQKAEENGSEKSEIVTIFHIPPGNSLSSPYFQFQLVPKQSSNNNYCAVCQQNFDDYLDVKILLDQHINDESHKKKLNRSKITAHIRELQGKYKKMRKEEPIQNPGLRIELCDYSSNELAILKEGNPERTELQTKNQFQSYFN